MRAFFGVVLLSFVPALAVAQTPLAPPPPPAALAPGTAVVPVPAPSAPPVFVQQNIGVAPPPPPGAGVLVPVGPPPVYQGIQFLADVDVLLGMQTGIRGQAGVWFNPCRGLVGEGFYGALFTKFGSGEAMGVGPRFIMRRPTWTGRDSILFAPGVDMLFYLHNDGPILIAPTIDVAWLHELGDRLGWEIGLNFGVGVGVSGTHNGSSAAGQVTPLISVFTGLRF